ncbi:hypothetical protein AAG906_021114 [Vitis piasezkii]
MTVAPSQNGVAERRNRTLKDMVRTETRPYKPNEKKLDSRIVSCYFVGYSERSRKPQVQVPLRRSTKERRSTISDDYVVYLQEHEFDMGLEDDPISVSQVKQSSNSEKWIEAMKDEMKSMKDNGV